MRKNINDLPVQDQYTTGGRPYGCVLFASRLNGIETNVSGAAFLGGDVSPTGSTAPYKTWLQRSE